jgi:hypothetical protein
MSRAPAPERPRPPPVPSFRSSTAGSTSRCCPSAAKLQQVRRLLSFLDNTRTTWLADDLCPSLQPRRRKPRPCQRNREEIDDASVRESIEAAANVLLLLSSTSSFKKRGHRKKALQVSAPSQPTLCKTPCRSKCVGLTADEAVRMARERRRRKAEAALSSDMQPGVVRSRLAKW